MFAHRAIICDMNCIYYLVASCYCIWFNMYSIWSSIKILYIKFYRKYKTEQNRNLYYFLHVIFNIHLQKMKWWSLLFMILHRPSFSNTPHFIRSANIFVLRIAQTNKRRHIHTLTCPPTYTISNTQL